MDKKMRQNMLLISFGIICFAVVTNLNHVFGFLRNIINMILPLLLGGVMAFVLSVPMGQFEKLLQKAGDKLNITPKEKRIRLLSLLLTFFTILLILILVGTKAIPEIINSVKSIASLVSEKWPQWAAVLKDYDIDTSSINEWMDKLKLDQMLKQLLSGAGVLFNVVAGTAASTISVIVTTAIALVVMFYLLIGKKDLQRQSKKILYAYLKSERADRIVYVASLIHSTYAKFLSGQCIEALILGVLMFLAFTVFRLPYAGLVAMLTGVCSFIPYVGAFISCGVGVILTLIANPPQAIVCLVVYQVVQFVENQFIYPNVVGNSVGLSPLWTLMAVLVGGKLFGLIGMIFFIPFVAVLYTLLREDMNRKLREKKIINGQNVEDMKDKEK